MISIEPFAKSESRVKVVLLIEIAIHLNFLKRIHKNQPTMENRVGAKYISDCK